MDGLNYKIKEFTLEDVTKQDSSIKIPQFQRGLVWSKDNQKNFIQTMMDGDPFGSILLSEVSDNEYLLVDGLQRVSTIKRFLNKPEDYIDSKFIDDVLFDEFLEIYINRNLVPESGKQQFIERFRNNLLDQYNQSSDAVTFADRITELYVPHDQDIRKIYNVVNKMFNNMQNKMKLNSALIPAIIYTGDEKRLPDVFERMNTGAVTLSKYEVLASTWYKFEIDINDDEISKYVKNKYNSLKEKSFLEVNFDIDELDSKINIFEYCYAISEILKNRKNGYTLLFGEKKKELSTDSIGFDIITVLLKNKVNDVVSIKNFIYEAPVNFLTEFKNAIKKTAEGISKILQPWVSFGFSEAKSELKIITGYQGIHIFASYFELLFDFDPNEYRIIEKNDRRGKELFKKYLPLHVLKDVVSNYWGINRQVSDLYLNITDTELLHKYQHSVAIDEFEYELINYIEKSNMNNRKTISSDSKFILNYIHKILIEKNQDYRDQFLNKNIDFDHITPKERVKDIMDDIAISSLANLCVMLPRDNRSKKNLTLYEDETNRAAYNLSQDILDMMIYPREVELRFLDLSKEQKKSQYCDFIKNRKNTLVNEIKKAISDYYRI